MITTIDGHFAELQKEQAWEHLTAEDVKNIVCTDSKYYPVSRLAEHTLTCEIFMLTAHHKSIWDGDVIQERKSEISAFSIIT